MGWNAVPIMPYLKHAILMWVENTNSFLRYSSSVFRVFRLSVTQLSRHFWSLSAPPGFKAEKQGLLSLWTVLCMQRYLLNKPLAIRDPFSTSGSLWKPPTQRFLTWCPLQPVATCGQTAVLMIFNSDLPPFKSVMLGWVLVFPCCWVKTYGFCRQWQSELLLSGKRVVYCVKWSTI